MSGARRGGRGGPGGRTRRPAACAWVVVLLLAAALRLLALGELPPGLHPDEAANAADALRAPLALAYDHEGGWVEGPYVWLAWPVLAAAERAGWSLEAALRLPAALAGLALIPAGVLLAARLASGPAAGSSAGLLAGLLLASAPWAVHHARLGLRAALVAPLCAWGLLLVTRADDQGRDRPALVGGLLLALAALTYPPARLVLPLLLLAWAVVARRAGRSSRPALLAAGPALLALVLLLPWTLGAHGGARLRDVLAVGQGSGPLADAWSALRGWALHFGPRFLWSGASSRGFAPEGVGLLPRVSAPLLGLGLIALLLRRDPWRPRLLLWLALAPLAAALTRDTPNPLRAAPLLPALAVLLALGAGALLAATPAGRWRRALRALLAGLIAAQGLIAFARYAHVHARAEARFYSAGREAALRAAAEEVARGTRVTCQDRFLGAFARLYAPQVPLARAPDGGWILGSDDAPAHAELLLLEPHGPVLARPGDRVLVPGVAWLRPR